MIICSACGGRNLANTVFCEECGQSLLVQNTTAPEPGVETRAELRKGASIRLVVQETGHVLYVSLDKEQLVGRADSQAHVHPDLDLTEDGALAKGVSRRHARITFQDAQPFIEDLGSTNGTWLGRMQLQPFLPHPIQDGDDLRLGNLTMRLELV